MRGMLAAAVICVVRVGSVTGTAYGSPPALEKFVNELLSKMTLEEKARQLVINGGDSVGMTNGGLWESNLEKWLDGKGAGVLDSMGRNVDPRLYNQIQATVLNSSRHGIGAIFGEECQHGVQGDHHTIFPSPYTVAAAFDRDLMLAIGRVIATEARAGGTSQCWAPVCGVAREPRWGRSEEEMSEDTFLAGELAANMVKGMTADGGDLDTDDTVAPLLKHYAAYSIPESGRNTAPAHIGRREMQEVFLPVFEKAVRAGALGAMSSYNEVDGVPTSSDHWLLTEQLRETFGFTGYVASDFGAISGLGPGNHASASNDSECVRQFIDAGGSVNGHDFGDNYEVHVCELVNEGRMSVATLNTAVGNVLRVKARLGLIKNGPYKESMLVTDETLITRHLGSNITHAAVATRAATESVVLLKNDRRTLPLSQSTKKLLVLGPNADEVRTGDYSAAGWAGGAPNGGGNINNLNSVTILEGLKKSFPGTEVTYAVGAGMECTPTNGFFSVVQRHSLSVASAFTPTERTDPYASGYGKTGALSEVAAGAQGLMATYYSTTNLTGEPSFTRNDMAVNWHFFALGPRLSASGTFSAKWEGVLTPDATVARATFNLELCHGHGCGGAANMGGRVYVNGKLVIDAWKHSDVHPFRKHLLSSPVDLRRGVGVSVRVEYWQASTQGNPAVALQWNLLQGSDQSVAVSDATSMVSSGAYDAVVVVVGGSNNDADSTTEGEGFDRAALSLAGNQLDLIKAVNFAAGAKKIPIAVVLVDGKPTAEPYLKSDVPAVIAAFQGGQAQGTGVAAVISGSANPSGKLPVSFPADAAVLPVYYNHKPSASRGGWCDFENGVLWAFGHGLSFTSFGYTKLAVPATVPADGTLRVTVDVTNTGRVAGTEVAQLYVRDVISSVTTPVKSLKGFERVTLAPGQTKTVSFEVDVADELRILNRAFAWEVEPGAFKVMVGGSSDDTPATGTFEVV